MRTAFCLLLILTLVGAAACGKKGPPTVALKSKEVRVQGLKAEAREGEGILLSWKVDGSSPELVGFFLQRGQERRGSSACRACPEFYRPLADLTLEQAYSLGKGKGFAFLDVGVQKGYHYYYRVSPSYRNGAVGRGEAVDIGYY